MIKKLIFLSLTLINSVGTDEVGYGNVKDKNSTATFVSAVVVRSTFNRTECTGCMTNKTECLALYNACYSRSISDPNINKKPQ